MTGVSIVISLSGRCATSTSAASVASCILPTVLRSSCGTRGESHFKQLSLHSSLAYGTGCERDALS